MAAGETESPATEQIALCERSGIGSYRRRQRGQRVHDGSVDAVGELETGLVVGIFVVRAAVRTNVDVDEAAPIESPVRNERAESGEALRKSGRSRRRNREDGKQNGVVEAVTGPNHGMTEAIGGDGKFDGHEREVFGMEEFEFAFVEAAVVLVGI